MKKLDQTRDSEDLQVESYIIHSITARKSGSFCQNLNYSYQVDEALIGARDEVFVMPLSCGDDLCQKVITL